MPDQKESFFSRRPQTEPEDELEKLRKDVISNRYGGKYHIDNNQMLTLIDRLQKAEQKLKELNETSNKT